MQTIMLGALEASRFILGSNPFSGFSHQGADMDREMTDYFTVERIKTVLHQAEQAGVTTLIARSDRHVIRMLREYWNEGGAIKWIAQTCPGVGPSDRVAGMAIDGGASAGFIHGGIMDFSLANDNFDDAHAGIKTFHSANLPVGVAGHNPKVFEWSEKNIDVDFYMCCYYNAAHRDKNPEKVKGQPEWFLEEDRKIMTELIQSLSRPVIHYKVLAAGRNEPADAIAFAAKAMRKGDGVCIGVYPKDNPNMIADNVQIFEQTHGV